MSDKPWPQADGEGVAPCPFCQLPPNTIERYVDTGGGDGRKWVAIDCDRHQNVVVRAHAFGPHGYSRPNDLPSVEAARQAAKAAWNQRADPLATPGNGG